MNTSFSKKVLTICLILITSFTYGQFSSEYQAVVNEATSLGYTLPSVADQQTQNAIVVSLKASGIWAESDLIYCFKGSGSKEFKFINWKNPTGEKGEELMLDGGSLTNSNNGISGDGRAILDTKFNPTQGANNYLQNNAGVYVKVSVEATSYFRIVASQGTGSAENISLHNRFQRNKINGGSDLPPIGTLEGTGLFGISRSNNTEHIISTNENLTVQQHGSAFLVDKNHSLFGGGYVTLNPFTKFDGQIEYAIIGADMSDKLTEMITAFNSTASGDTEAPTAPAGVTASAITTTSATINWTASTDNTAVTGYKVFQNGTEVTTLGDVTSYNATGLSPATTYNYTITALDAAGNESVASTAANFTTGTAADTQAPSVPTNVTASAITTTIATISWTASTDNEAVTGYKVFQNGIDVATLGNVTTYNATGLSPSTSYAYTVSALDAAGNESAASTAANFTTATAADTQNPSVPTNLTASTITTSSITLNWNAATDNIGVTGYRIYQDGTQISVLGNVLTFDVSGLTANTTYAFTVSAADAAGNESMQSTAVNVTTESGGTTGGGPSVWSTNGTATYYSNGNVGIGTSNTDATLTVKGDIHAEEVKIDLSVPAPDYVFLKDYKLKTLTEVEAYIKQHGHLPNIPSAKEMESNGVQLGIMNMKLLEKIEELTLHMIRLQQELTKDQQTVKELKEDITNLKKSNK